MIEEKFALENFRVGEFIHELLADNRPQQRYLSLDVFKAAVEHYGSIRYRSASRDIMGNFRAQVS